MEGALCFALLCSFFVAFSDAFDTFNMRTSMDNHRYFLERKTFTLLPSYRIISHPLTPFSFPLSSLPFPSGLPSPLTSKPKPSLTPPISRITVRPQQQRHMKVFPLPNNKSQINKREERLPRPIISPRIERQLPKTAAPPHHRVPLLLPVLLYQRSNALLLRCRLGFPVRDPPVAVRRRDECEGWCGAAA